MDWIESYLQQLEQVIHSLPRQEIWQATRALMHARRNRQHVFIVGNGGSAATAAHMVNDLNKLPAAADGTRFKASDLVSNTPWLTALANDNGYEDAFSNQLQNFIEPGDVVIAISTSGNSPNIIKAIQFARQHQAFCIGFTGCSGGKLKSLVDICVCVPGDLIGHQEDVHMVLDHCIAFTIHHLTEAERVQSQRKAIFLDRDGVICYNRQNYVKSWEEFSFLPGALDALRKLAQLDYVTVVISNQSAIGRGLMTEKTASDINRRMQEEIRKHGGHIDSVFTCPHRPEENCSCRKPQPGLILLAAQQTQLDLEHSLFIGDALSDMQAALAAGCQPIMVLTGRGAEQRKFLNNGYTHIPVKVDLAEAVDWIYQQV
jgi:histidinol-phosphate phosphatase family protein